MSEQSASDPQLSFLEAKLAAVSLHVSPETAQQYLYECGVAAGQVKTRPALRRWRILASMLAMAVVAVSVPRFLHQAPAPLATNTKQSLPPATSQAKAPAEIELDAWQLPEPDRTAAVDEIARLAQNDPNLRSRTVAALTRQALAHE
jgi:hypothetical protein